MQPIKVWGHWAGPNPWKVCMILKELKIPYDYEIIEFSETKKEPFVKLNPNGRLPAIEDPNTGIKLWETGAIILYLIEQYDQDEKLSYKSTTERYDCIKWLMFQVSGQGPYFGQLAWFARFHQPKIPSAIDRYANEMDRVLGVLNTSLQGRKWLVGDKCTFADLSFVSWCHVAKGLLKELGKSDVLEKYPNYVSWLESMEQKEGVKECLEEMATQRAAHGLPP